MNSARPFPSIRPLVPGLVLAASIAALAVVLAGLPALRDWGLGALTLAIAIGILVGNTVFPRIATHAAPGIDLARGRLLRLGIVLYGFRITFQQIGDVGWAGLAIDVVVIASVMGLATTLGPRLFGLDRQTSILIGTGSAVCGAAAVLAAEPVLRAPAHRVSVAVSTVVVFGTLAMLVYPLLYPLTGFDEHTFGLYAGSTIHEVAQVVVAGHAVGPDAEATAVIQKMLRVMLLAPLLVVLSALLRTGSGEARAPITIPWFAVLFVVVSGFNSLHLLPAAWVAGIDRVDTALLAMAMAALGVRTHVGAVRQAGVAPLLLAALLFACLVSGGWALTAGMARLAG